MLKIILTFVWVSWAAPSPIFMSEVSKEIETINTMREGLVKAVPKNPDAKTFKQVCKPVGMSAKALSKRKKWTVRQASEKYRNPAHEANKQEIKALKRFEADKALLSYFEVVGDKVHYFRRIEVRKDCLSCHGSKSSRPAFVLKKYPKDKAYGFKEGDLRGLYHVVKKQQ